MLLCFDFHLNIATFNIFIKLSSLFKPKTVMKKKLLLIGVVFFTLTCTVKAYINYVPGYIIDMKGDTIKGFIETGNWEASPQNITFSESPESSPWRVLNPKIIKGFGFKDESYVSATIQVEVSPVQLQVLEKNSKLNLITQDAFLQTLVRGDKSLYAFTRMNTEEQYYIKLDTGYVLLMHKKYLNVVKGREYLSENKTYIGQLTQYLNDYPDVLSALGTIRYTKSDLKKLFLTYYEKTNKKKEFLKKTTPIGLEYGVLAGASVSQLNFKGKGFGYLFNMDYPVSPSISGGLFLDVPFSGGLARWIIANDILYTRYSFSGDYVDYVNDNNYTTYTTELQHGYIKLHTLLKYKIPTGRFAFFANGGVSNGFMISEKNYQKKVSKFYESETTLIGKVTDESKKWELGFVFGIGASFKNFSLDLRGESGNGFSPYTALTSKTMRYYFLLGYSF
jgi:hypothetical protein